MAHIKPCTRDWYISEIVKREGGNMSYIGYLRNLNKSDLVEIYMNDINPTDFFIEKGIIKNKCLELSKSQVPKKLIDELLLLNEDYRKTNKELLEEFLLLKEDYQEFKKAFHNLMDLKTFKETMK